MFALLALAAAPPPPPPHAAPPPHPLLRGLLGGAAYGLAAAVLSHPFDTLKTQRQASDHLAAAPRALSASPRALARLYRGIGPAALGSMCFRTVPFLGYEATAAFLASRRLLDGFPLAAAFVAGAAGGVMRGCLETPAELVKTRLQLRRAWGGAQLLRGLFSTCLRNGVVIGLYWTFFEASKPAREAFLPPVASSFAAGGGCSVLAWAVVYPLDTAKSRIQASAAPTGVWQQLRAVYRTAGLRGWYAGLAPGLARAFLANGGGMVFYDLIQRALSAPSQAKDAL